MEHSRPNSQKKSLKRSIKSASPTGKQCPFLDGPQQSNQRRHLRTACTTLENEIALKKKFLLAYLPDNDRRADAKHSQSVQGCSKRCSLCQGSTPFPSYLLDTSHLPAPTLTWAEHLQAMLPHQSRGNKIPKLCDELHWCLVFLSQYKNILNFALFFHRRQGHVVELSSPCKYLLLKSICSIKLL